MARTRRRKPELTDSWADVDDNSSLYASDSPEGSDFLQQEEAEDRMQSRATRWGRDDFTSRDGQDGLHKRVTRSSVEPELVMPASPNAVGGTARAKTPRFRMNDRSMTSDAGNLDAGRKVRARTPHFRMNERSMTSDAGRFMHKSFMLREEENVEGARPSQYLYMLWYHFLHPLLAFVGDIVGTALVNAKPLMSYVLLAYLVGAAIVFSTGFLNNTINNALSPICRVPGVTYFFSPSFCSTNDVHEVEGPAEFEKLVQAQSAFNDVLAASSAGANLPLDMKRSEAGIRDLKHVVQYSSLPSKHELVFEFGGFIDTARQASQDLSRFNSRIGRAVDQILSTNRWTLSVIDGVAASQASRGSVVGFFADHLNIFAPFQPLSLSRDILLDQYLRHTSAVEEQILNLITEAQALLAILENLDGRLDIIASIATRDGLKAQENKDELFAYIWTKLGGNRASVQRVDSQLRLLKDVSSYRRIAWAHVTTTIVKLQAIRDNLEDLRERVAMPETIGADKVPLEVHIGSINLGIERLEKQRDISRKAEAENYQRVISRAGEEGGKMIGE